MKRTPILIALALIALALIPPARASAQPHSVPLSAVAEEVEAFTRWESLGDGFTRSYDRRAEIHSFYKEKPAPSPPKTHEWQPYVGVDGRAFWRKEDTHGWTYYNAREWSNLRFQDAATFAAWHKASRIEEPAKQARVVLTNGQWMTEGVLRDQFHREYSAGKYLGPGQVEPDAAAGDAADLEGRCKDPQPGLLNLWGIPASIAGIPTLLFILGLTLIIGGLGLIVFVGLLIALIVWLCRRK